MKKMILIAASLFIASISFGHGNGWANRGNATGENQGQFWQQMNTWHQVMQDAKVNAKNTENGVKLEVAVSSDEIQKRLTDDFKVSQSALTAFFESVDVSLETQESGFVIEFTSSDENVIKRLQNSGSGLFYDFLHQEMSRVMHSGPGYGPMNGHHMGGNGGQWGHGPGAMHDNEQNYHGYGPGAMHGNYQNHHGYGSETN